MKWKQLQYIKVSFWTWLICSIFSMLQITPRGWAFDYKKCAGSVRSGQRTIIFTNLHALVCPDKSLQSWHCGLKTSCPSRVLGKVTALLMIQSAPSFIICLLWVIAIYLEKSGTLAIAKSPDIICSWAVCWGEKQRENAVARLWLDKRSPRDFTRKEVQTFPGLIL